MMITSVWPVQTRAPVCKLQRRSSVTACAPKPLHPADRLQKLLQDSSKTIPAPAVYDGLSARMVCQKGFMAAFISGFSVAAARYGEPDVGLMSFGENRDAIRDICTAVNSCARECGIEAVPLIADADTGYGNEANVKKTYYALAELGVAGIIIEDQQTPKACGHVQGRQVVSRVEARMRIRAAVEARDDLRSRFGNAPLIFARTDARQVELIDLERNMNNAEFLKGQASSLDEALDRVKIFADEGADVLFIDALTSISEMRSFANVCSEIPHMTNMLEGGGKTPICEIWELSEMGFNIVAFPLSLLSVSVSAMEKALTYLKNGVVPDNRTLSTFSHLQDILGFDYYLERSTPGTDSEDKTNNIEDGSSAVDPSSLPELSIDSDRTIKEGDTLDKGEPQAVAESNKENDEANPSQRTNAFQKVEPSYIIPPKSQLKSKSESESESESESTPTEESTILTSPKQAADNDSSKSQSVRTLRLKISENGKTKVDLRAPAGFADSLLSMVPGDIIESTVLKNIATVQQNGSGLILDVNEGDTRIQVWLE